MRTKTSQAYRPIPDDYRHTLIKELEWQHQAQPADKDILIVVHDALTATKDCLISLARTTTNYSLFIWDNNSKKPTANYLKGIAPNLLFRSETNEGFIVPNNKLMKLGHSPYIILLNNDTVLSPNWSEAMIGCLQANPEIGIVGYEGVLLNEHGIGSAVANGHDADFIAGWCMCFRRTLYEEIGGFDSVNLAFAYGEDSDFCLRAKERGHQLYGLSLKYLRHLGQTTIGAVQTRETGEIFATNHAYLRTRWHDYLVSKHGKKKER